MNLIEEAKALGFSDAAVISTDQLDRKSVV